jgi:hypothetical protein
LDNSDFGYSDKELELAFASPVTIAGSKKIEEPYKETFKYT